MFRALVMLGFLASSGLAWAGDFKAAWVDMQRAISECDEGRVARSRFQAVSEERQRQIDKELALIKIDSAKVEELAPGPDRKKAEDEIRRRTLVLQERTQRTRTELDELERKELANVVPKLEALLGQIAKRDGFTMVFDRSSNAIAFAPPTLDLTNELIRMYNTQYPLKAPLK